MTSESDRIDHNSPEAVEAAIKLASRLAPCHANKDAMEFAGNSAIGVVAACEFYDEIPDADEIRLNLAVLANSVVQYFKEEVKK